MVAPIIGAEPTICSSVGDREICGPKMKPCSNGTCRDIGAVIDDQGRIMLLTNLGKLLSNLKSRACTALELIAVLNQLSTTFKNGRRELDIIPTVLALRVSDKVKTR